MNNSLLLMSKRRFFPFLPLKSLLSFFYTCSSSSPCSSLATCQLGRACWNLLVLNTRVLEGKNQHRMFCLHIHRYFSSISEPLMYCVSVHNMEKTWLGWYSYRSHPFWTQLLYFTLLPDKQRWSEDFLRRPNRQQECWLKWSVPVKWLASWRRGINPLFLQHITRITMFLTVLIHEPHCLVWDSYWGYHTLFTPPYAATSK